MPKSLIISNSSSSVNDALTRYYPIGGRLLVQTTEPRLEIPFRDAGVVRNLLVNVISNTHTTASSTFATRKNQAAGNQSVVYSAGQTGIKEDNTNSDTISTTDEFNYQLVTGANAGTTTIATGLISVEFEPDSSSDYITKISAHTTIIIGSGTFYCAPAGGNMGSISESLYQTVSPVNATLSDLYTYVTTNSRSSDTTVRVRNNGSDGNQSVVYSAAQTGAKEDNSNSDTISAGNTFNYQIVVAAGSGSFTQTMYSLTYATSNAGFILTSGSTSNSGTTIATSTTSYTGLAFIVFSSTESNYETYPRFDFNISDLNTYVNTNASSSGTMTVTVRDSETDSALNVVYSAAQTGLKTDSSNSATISSTDLLDYKFANASDSDITFMWTSVLGKISNNVIRTLLLMGIGT